MCHVEIRSTAGGCRLRSLYGYERTHNRYRTLKNLHCERSDIRCNRHSGYGHAGPWIMSIELAVGIADHTGEQGWAYLEWAGNIGRHVSLLKQPTADCKHFLQELPHQ